MSTAYFRFTPEASSAPARAPLLERLLARAEPGIETEDWRAHAFRLIAPEGTQIPAPASAAMRGVEGAGSWAMLATPVHFVAGLTSVSLPLDGILALESDETQALVEDFARVLGGTGARLLRSPASWLLFAFDSPLDAVTHDPAIALGRDIWSFLPSGGDAGVVRRFMTEIEMWLFEHPVNTLRRMRNSPSISSLWLWGGGATNTPLPKVLGWTAGADPLFSAFAPLQRYPNSGASGVLVTQDPPGSESWRRLETDWLAPALSELRAGRLERIELSAGNRCFRASALDTRKFWRRSKPWWTFFADSDA